MENRKRLYRRCAGGCGRVLPVVRWDEDVADEEYDDTVRWQSDPFASEIHQDETPMWLCGRCAYESSMEI